MSRRDESTRFFTRFQIYRSLCSWGIVGIRARYLCPQKPLSFVHEWKLYVPTSLMYSALFARSVSNLWIAIPAPVFYPAWAWPIIEWSRTPALLCVLSGSPPDLLRAEFTSRTLYLSQGNPRLTVCFFSSECAYKPPLRLLIPLIFEHALVRLICNERAKVRNHRISDVQTLIQFP